LRRTAQRKRNGEKEGRSDARVKKWAPEKGDAKNLTQGRGAASSGRKGGPQQRHVAPGKKVC